jgi:hypothetical protein
MAAIQAKPWHASPGETEGVEIMNTIQKAACPAGRRLLLGADRLGRPRLDHRQLAMTQGTR